MQRFPSLKGLDHVDETVAREFEPSCGSWFLHEVVALGVQVVREDSVGALVGDRVRGEEERERRAGVGVDGCDLEAVRDGPRVICLDERIPSIAKPGCGKQWSGPAWHRILGGPLGKCYLDIAHRSDPRRNNASPCFGSSRSDVEMARSAAEYLPPRINAPARLFRLTG